MFCTDCINVWLKNRIRCPTCKGEVNGRLSTVRALDNMALSAKALLLLFESRECEDFQDQLTDFKEVSCKQNIK